MEKFKIPNCEKVSYLKKYNKKLQQKNHDKLVSSKHQNNIFDAVYVAIEKLKNK